VKVLVVYKKTALQRYDAEHDPRLSALLDEGDASVAKLRTAHQAHMDTVTRARKELAALGVDVVFRQPSRAHPPERWDLVVTLGGDGTLLWSSHGVGSKTPMVAINSDPDNSVGYFCAGDRHDLEETLTAALEGKLQATRLARMEVGVDDAVLSRRVLNDILFCHECPAAATRYIMRFGEHVESHTSSGIWAGPAAGSTAAQRSAGGKVLPLRSKKLQWVVREPYTPGGEKLELVKGLVAQGAELSLKTKIREGRIYLDGANMVSSVDIGSTITLRLSPEPLTLLGLRSRS